MKMNLALKGYSLNTQKTYLKNVIHFSNYFNKPPELLTEDDIREYLFHNISVRKLSASFYLHNYLLYLFYQIGYSSYSYYLFLLSTPYPCINFYMSLSFLFKSTL
ncbi:phage integrase N-terminal SAM-like domain-containing protein [Anaerovirgula multivorans]